MEFLGGPRGEIKLNFEGILVTKVIEKVSLYHKMFA